MSEHIEGLVAAPHTPMDADGGVNLDAIAPQAEFLARNNVVGAFICGTTGESLSLTIDERIAIARRWTETAPEGLRVIVHVGAECLDDARRLASQAAQAGAWAISAMSPCFFKPATVGSLAAHCAQIAAAAPELPFYYYHIPSMSGGHFPMTDFLDQAADLIPNLAGIKYTHEDLMEYEACRAAGGGRFDILFGRDETLICALALGGRGAVGSTYNFAAPLYHDLIAAYDSGDLERARALQRKSIEIITILAAAPCGFGPAAKSVMRMLGVDCGPARSPLERLAPKDYETLRDRLEAINFFDYCSK